MEILCFRSLSESFSWIENFSTFQCVVGGSVYVGGKETNQPKGKPPESCSMLMEMKMQKLHIKSLIMIATSKQKQQMVKLREIAIYKTWDYVAEFSRNGGCTNYNCHARAKHFANCFFFFKMCQATHIILKHCQRHNGPEGWVHLAKSNFLRSYHKSWSHFIFRIPAKHQLKISTKHQHPN